MKFGVRAHDYGRFTPEDLMAQIAADGFSSVQLACKKAVAGVTQLSDLTMDVLEEIRAQLLRHDLSVAVYGSYVELGLADDTVRAQQAEEFRAQLTNACALSTGCIGSETTSVTQQPHISRKESMAALRRSLEAVLPEAERLNMIVAIEPVASHTLHTPEATAALLRDLKSPWLKVIFDPVNLLTIEQLATQRDLWDRSFDCMGAHITAVHIKGVREGKPGILEKCGLLDSQIDWAYIAPRLVQIDDSLTILREEAVPSQAQQDLQYMKNLFV